MVPPSSFLAQALSWDWMWIETSSDADCDDEQLWGLRKHGYEAFHQDSFPKV